MIIKKWNVFIKTSTQYLIPNIASIGFHPIEAAVGAIGIAAGAAHEKQNFNQADGDQDPEKDP